MEWFVAGAEAGRAPALVAAEAGMLAPRADKS